MTSRLLMRCTTMTVFVMLTNPPALGAQQNHQFHHYKLIDLGTLGGPQSREDGFNGEWPTMNNRGTITGLADTSAADPFYPNVNPMMESDGPPDPYIFHAFQWKNGQLADLGSLPGGYKSAPTSISKNGLIAGEAINGALDPISGWPEENAVFWKNGRIQNLSTLGGYESAANQVNSQGQTIGFSTNTVSDPYSIIYSLFFGLSNGTQTRAFVWDQKHGMTDLGTLGGPDAFAVSINENEEVAGFSYTSSTPTIDPFLWEPPTRRNPNGTMIDLGTLGGTFGLVGDGLALNNEGQVVGVSNLAGDTYSHAFLWTKPGPMQDLGTFGGNYGQANAVNEAGEVAGWATNTGDQALLAFFWKDGVMTNLGTLPGDLCSYAHIISSKHQVLGDSDDDCNGGDDRGFLWESGGGMVDLNSLVTGADMTLGFPTSINDRGEISGIGLLANGNLHLYLLIPCDNAHPGVAGCDYSMVDTPVTAARTTPPVHNGPAIYERSRGRSDQLRRFFSDLRIDSNVHRRIAR